MGNDGGSIPTRRELVKEAARNPSTSQLKKTVQERLDFLWRNDPLTNEPLQLPVVSDALGRLYNKDSILEYLLPLDETDKSAKHRRDEQTQLLDGAVSGLKDVVEIRFHVKDGNDRWVCPITGVPLGSAQKSIYIVPCGHAFTAAALEEIEEDKCLQCDEPYASNDVIPILPTGEEDIAQLTLRRETLKERGLSHSLKKAGKKDRKRKKRAVEASAGEDMAALDEQAEVKKATKSIATKGKENGGSINDSGTASLTAKVMQEQQQRNKKRKTESNSNIDSLFSKKSDPAKVGKNNDFMTRGYAVQTQR